MVLKTIKFFICAFWGHKNLRRGGEFSKFGEGYTCDRCGDSWISSCCIKLPESLPDKGTETIDNIDQTVFLPKTAKCHYCENQSTKTLIWLKDKKQQPARIKLPWCGCDLQVALKKFWHSPYTVVEGRVYETKSLS